MNWFDYLLLAIVALYLVGGLVQGALKQIFNLFGFFIALALAFLGTRYLGGYGAALLKPEWFLPYEEVLQSIGVTLKPEGMMDLAGAALTFLVLLVVLVLLIRLVVHWLSAVNKVPVIGFFNRLGGGLLGLLTGILICFAIVSTASLLPFPFLSDALKSSLVAGYMDLYLPPLVAGVKTALIEFFLRGRAGGEI